jgi:hypothetical protein
MADVRYTAPDYLFYEDPRQSLIAFRTEIEQRLRELAESNSIQAQQPAPVLIQNLTNLGVLNDEAAAGLVQLIAFGNEAVHGEAVDTNAGTWLRTQGLEILRQLDLLASAISVHELPATGNGPEIVVADLTLEIRLNNVYDADTMYLAPQRVPYDLIHGAHQRAVPTTRRPPQTGPSDASDSLGEENTWAVLTGWTPLLQIDFVDMVILTLRQRMTLYPAGAPSTPRQDRQVNAEHLVTNVVDARAAADLITRALIRGR